MFFIKLFYFRFIINVLVALHDKLSSIIFDWLFERTVESLFSNIGLENPGISVTYISCNIFGELWPKIWYHRIKNLHNLNNLSYVIFIRVIIKSTLFHHASNDMNYLDVKVW